MRIGYGCWHEVSMHDICVYMLLGCSNMFGMWSVYNSLKSLGEISGSCFSGRDVSRDIHHECKHPLNSTRLHVSR